MKLRWAIGVSVVVALATAGFVVSAGAEPREVAPSVAAVAAAPIPEPAPAAVVAQRPVAPTPPRPPELAARALASAQTTVQSQLNLLADNQYDLFVQTFSAEVRPQLTRDVYEACRVRVNQVPVKPDWEMAEDATEGGKRVTSVSIFGKSLTAFEETDGRWLATSVWCLPVGLP